MTVFALVLLALLSSPLATARAHAGDHPDRIVFASARNGNTDLWVADPDGGHAVRLTTDPQQDVQPHVSPDGTRIVFVRGWSAGSVPQAGDLWIMDADGTGARPLLESAPGVVEYRPFFSPDGRTILFGRHADGIGLAQELWVVGADGRGARRLVGNATYGHWSPDGTKIAYGGAQITVVDADGSNPVTLTSRGGTAPQWSPDGTRIVFTSFRSGRGEIWMIGADGSDEHLVTSSAGKEGFATWSPDGTRIAWASTRHTPCPAQASDACPQRVHTMNADGTGVRPLVSDGVHDWFPTYWPRPRPQ